MCDSTEYVVVVEIRIKKTSELYNLKFSVTTFSRKLSQMYNVIRQMVKYKLLQFSLYFREILLEDWHPCFSKAVS